MTFLAIACTRWLVERLGVIDEVGGSLVVRVVCGNVDVRACVSLDVKGGVDEDGDGDVNGVVNGNLEGAAGVVTLCIGSVRNSSSKDEMKFSMSVVWALSGVAEQDCRTLSGPSFASFAGRASEWQWIM